MKEQLHREIKMIKIYSLVLLSVLSGNRLVMYRVVRTLGQASVYCRERYFETSFEGLVKHEIGQQGWHGVVMD